MVILNRMGFLFFFLLSGFLFSQETIRITRAESEKLFLEKNLLLLAEKLNIDRAEAEYLQAKLWPNPTLEIEEVNLWATDRQIEILSDELPAFGNGSFGRHQQFAASLEQLILTAGKRKKLMAIEEVSIEKSKQYFEDLLRSLKLEFRNKITELQYLQLKTKVFENQVESLDRLISAYKNQLDQGHISKSEYVRLKALQLEVKKEKQELDKEFFEAENDLRLLLQLPKSVNLEIDLTDFQINPESLPLISFEQLVEEARDNRPDFKLANLEKDYFNKLYKYEKSNRITDVNFKVNYDRGGNILYNFIGFGLSFDLPVFDRNQGNIKQAKIEIDRSEILKSQMELELEHEVSASIKNLERAVEFLKEIDSDYENDLDMVFESYTRNYTQRNINLLEFLDFFEIYLENKEIILEAIKDVRDKVEELNFTIGTDIMD